MALEGDQGLVPSTIHRPEKEAENLDCRIEGEREVLDGPVGDGGYRGNEDRVKEEHHLSHGPGYEDATGDGRRCPEMEGLPPPRSHRNEATRTAATATVMLRASKRTVPASSTPWNRSGGYSIGFTSGRQVRSTPAPKPKTQGLSRTA